MLLKKVFCFILSILFVASVGLYARSGGGHSCGTSTKTLSKEKIKKATPSVTRREIRQRARIAEGVKSGELDKEEAKGLVENQKEIREMQQEAREDGTVTKEERIELQKKLSEESKEIYQHKHDTQKR